MRWNDPLGEPPDGLSPVERAAWVELAGRSSAALIASDRIVLEVAARALVRVRDGEDDLRAELLEWLALLSVPADAAAPLAPN